MEQPIEADIPNPTRQLRQAVESNDVAQVQQILDAQEDHSVDFIADALTHAIKHDLTEIFDLLTEELLRWRILSYEVQLNKCYVVAYYALLSNNPTYWQLLGPLLSGRIRFDLMHHERWLDCSLPVLRSIHERGEISAKWWVGIFLHAVDHHEVSQRVHDLWQIRLSLSGSYDEMDRALVGDIVLECLKRRAGATSVEQYLAIIVTLLKIYPEAIADHQEKMIRAIAIHKDCHDDYLKPAISWLVQTDLVDHTLLIPMIPEMENVPSKLRPLLTRISAHEDVQYFSDKQCQFWITWSPLLSRKVEGWATFRFAGRYFYSPSIYLEIDSGKIVAAEPGLMIAPRYQDREMAMPLEELSIEIEYGRGYQNKMIISAPQILADWYHSRNSAKSARSIPKSR